ncbi:uncharacterized protein FA14DRAFT_160692 [Meira miltonrushii]|uniref:Uncharacterized protein n=1 Tax=Meira miltonrushii TaxID=1280837 RepID=A0A316VEZ2_9BASI|nr:uncharacterized protein FA14DRAFT_160692 [Meira miltonrushii]PWN35628.1 hypothetical protein FA14DRAFT_160692 [Meira miltonrushii]
MRFSIFAAFLSLAFLAKASDNPDDPNGSTFYLAKPACNYYRCQVKTHPGAVLPIEWLNPIKGKIDIFFNPDDGQKGLKTYTIAKNIGAHNNKNKCNAEGQHGCGAFDWTVPADVKPGNYSVEIHSLTKKKVYGYSDIVTVTSGKKKRSAPVQEVEEKQPEQHKNEKVPAVHEKKHKNATKPVKHHEHKDATKPDKHHKHKNATEHIKHHHKGKKGKDEHAKHHHKHEHKKHNSTTEKGKKHHKEANKTQTSEHKRKRMVQTALF